MKKYSELSIIQKINFKASCLRKGDRFGLRIAGLCIMHADAINFDLKLYPYQYAG
jgi:hypothetical protein